MGLVDDYTRAIHDELRPVRAQWPIGAPLQLGDYGALLGNRFELRGNLADLEIPFAQRDDTGDDYVSFRSAGGMSVELKGRVEAPVGGIPVNANATIGFSAKHAVFMNLAGCRWATITNRDALRQAFREAYDRGAWREHYYFVSRLAVANSSTIIVSSSSSASVKLEASADVPNIDLANPSVELTATSERDVAVSTVSTGGLTPLFELGQWERGNPYGPRAIAAEDFESPAAQEDILHVGV